MSTPSRKDMTDKYAEGKALDLFARWAAESLETFEAVLSCLPTDGTDFEAGQVCLLRDMLRPIARESRALAVMKHNAARSMASERLAAAELEALDALATTAIRPDQRRLYEDAYLAGKRVDPDDHPGTQKTLAQEAETEELTQEPPPERRIAGTERLYLVEEDKGGQLSTFQPLEALDEAEVAAAMADAKLYGTGYLVDGHRVAPQVVRVMIRRPDGELEELETA